MAMKGGNPKNLRVPTSEEARKIGAKGGKKSAQVRKEKRLMSQIFAELLSDGLDDDIKKAAPKIIKKGGSSSVSLMKVIAETTEGVKNKTELSLNVNQSDPAVSEVLDKYGVTKKSPD